MTGYETLVLRQDWGQATDSDWVKVLASLPVFEGFSKRRLRKVARRAHFADYARGDEIVSTGSAGDAFYVILSGSAKARGKPAARTLRAGDYFGEMAVLDGGPRSATVVATSELQVMRVPREAFLELAEDEPALTANMLAQLGARVRELEGQAAQR
jgi:CRP/FNR family transcriptional regulator, cyclic AMP receptor protein